MFFFLLRIWSFSQCYNYNNNKFFIKILNWSFFIYFNSFLIKYCLFQCENYYNQSLRCKSLENRKEQDGERIGFFFNYYYN